MFSEVPALTSILVGSYMICTRGGSAYFQSPFRFVCVRIERYLRILLRCTRTHFTLKLKSKFQTLSSQPSEWCLVCCGYRGLFWGIMNLLQRNILGENKKKLYPLGCWPRRSFPPRLQQQLQHRAWVGLKIALFVLRREDAVRAKELAGIVTQQKRSVPGWALKPSACDRECEHRLVHRGLFNFTL